MSGSYEVGKVPLTDMQYYTKSPALSPLSFLPSPHPNSFANFAFFAAKIIEERGCIVES